jgi:hypothetical protein
MIPSDIFHILDTAGVSISDFARLTGCSRQMLTRIKKTNDAEHRDRIRYHILTTEALKIDQALKHRRLPLKDKHFTSERLKVLRHIIG